MDYMQRALSLAKKALGHVSPNPAVGAVVVKEGEIVGEGYTQPPGSAHAEVGALLQAGDRARGAIMYVTLEPCCHLEKRTPPCTRAIISAQISEVHMATLDPNPRVSGRGQAELEAAGIKTHLGEHEEEAREVNEPYIKFITTGIPFVIAKFAMSLDGKIATRSGDSKWISGEESRRYVHSLRQMADAIMVGVGTVLRDDPQLTARAEEQETREKQPLRVIVDSFGRTRPQARLFQMPGKTLLAVTAPLEEVKARQFNELGAQVLELPSKEGLVDLTELLKALGKREVTCVLVEGGGTLLGSLFDLGLVDKVFAFITPIIIGGKNAVTPVAGGGVAKIAEALRLSRVQTQQFGQDIMISGYMGR
jgi:diaminohydroxyphosphoribosylaminopyrimidine deaminase/5-amino-6-(5-phosphoribosylamino)uracil reductase